MTPLSHEQVRRRLHAAADGRLGSLDQTALDDHLAQCAACRDYAAELDRAIQALVQALRRRWDRHAPPADFAGRAVTRALRPDTRRPVIQWAAPAVLVGLLVALGAVSYLLLIRPAALPGGIATEPAIHVLGVHHVLPKETLRCIAMAYGVTAAAIQQANDLGQPPQLRNDFLLIPTGPIEPPLAPAGPTCSPQFVAPHALDPVTIPTDPALLPFTLRGVAAGPPPGACDALSITGQVYGRTGAPIAGLVMYLEGDGLELEAATGGQPHLGPAGYALRLDHMPPAPSSPFRVQLRNTNGRPLSTWFPVETFDDCGRNTFVMDFVQR